LFMEIYVWPEYKNSKKRYGSIGYDIRNDLYVFARSLGIADNISILDLYLKTSIFEGMVPYMSRELASHHIGLLSKREDFSGILPPVNHMVQKLKICPECAKGEQNQIGSYYFHRAHQLPGVTVCHKPGNTLLEYCGKRGKELKEQEAFKPLPSYHDSLEYAKFCFDFLNAEIQISKDVIMQLIKDKMRELNYTSSTADKMIYDMGTYAELAEEDIEHFIKITLFSGTYVNIQTSMLILMFLFKTVEELKKYLTIESAKDDFYKISNRKFEIISDWREDIIELVCVECGCQFLSIPNRILSGWGCPDCDRKLTEKELFQRIDENG